MSWPYETYHYFFYGEPYYMTTAMKFFNSENRLYQISLSDNNNDTLEMLDYWASSFKG
jgi:hypothetical protein